MKGKGSNTPNSGAIAELIQKIAGTYGKTNVRLFDATVNSVNVEERTCQVDSIDSSLYDLTVRFMLEVSDGDMSVPQEGSTVTVAMTDFTEPYIVSQTWIDEKLFVVGNQSYSIKDGKQIFNDGSFDGLMKIVPSIKAWNDTIDDINKLKQAFAAWTPVANDGGAALKTSLAANYPVAQLTEIEQDNIENKNITHGPNFS